MQLTHLSLTALSLLGAALFQTATATPPPTPGLSYLGTATISIASPFKVGPGPLGDRNVYPITGGSFTGPNFTGMFTTYLIQPLTSTFTNPTQHLSQPSEATGAWATP